MEGMDQDIVKMFTFNTLTFEEEIRHVNKFASKKIRNFQGYNIAPS